MAKKAEPTARRPYKQRKSVRNPLSPEERARRYPKSRNPNGVPAGRIFTPEEKAKFYPVARNPAGPPPDANRGENRVNPNSFEPDSLAVATLRNFEGAFGREKIVDVLQHAPEMSFEEERFLNILADPRSDMSRLDAICRRLSFPVGKFLNFFKKAYGAEATLKALDEVYGKMPSVAKDIMDRSIPHRLPCRECFAAGRIELEDGESKKCKQCNGTGFTDHLPELERQKVALQIGGLLKSDTKIQQSNTVNVGFQVVRSDAEFRAATDKLLFARNPESAEAIAAEITEKSEDDADPVPDPGVRSPDLR